MDDHQEPNEVRDKSIFVGLLIDDSISFLSPV